jgi:tRNA-intron endonuclease
MDFFVPSLSEANSLFSEGYGLRSEFRFTLTFYEVLYLLENNKIAVIDEKTRINLDFKELFIRFSNEDAFFWTKYIVYRDLRSRGFIAREIGEIKDGFKRACNKDIFEVWERGQFSKQDSSYFLKIIIEGLAEATSSLINDIERSGELNKMLKLAVIDRRGEIVYYSLRPATL